MNIAVVSFDVWDTLLRLKPFYFSIANEIGLENNISPARVYEDMLKNYAVLKEYRSKGMLRYDDIVNHCLELSSDNLDIDIELLKRSITRAILNVEPNEILVKEALQVLSELKFQGKKIVTLGNLIFWPGYYNRILLERTGLTKYFDHQLYADEIKFSKPSKEIFSWLYRMLNLEPQRIVHIGDNKIEDYEGALNSGFYGIWVNPSYDNSVEIKNKSAIVNSISQIPRVVKVFDGDLN